MGWCSTKGYWGQLRPIGSLYDHSKWPNWWEFWSKFWPVWGPKGGWLQGVIFFRKHVSICPHLMYLCACFWQKKMKNLEKVVEFLVWVDEGGCGHRMSTGECSYSSSNYGGKNNRFFKNTNFQVFGQVEWLQRSVAIVLQQGEGAVIPKNRIFLPHRSDIIICVKFVFEKIAKK